MKMMKSFGKPGEIWVKLINSVDEVNEVYQKTMGELEVVYG